MKIKEFFSFKKNGFFWLNLLAMAGVAVLLLWGVLRGLDAYTRHGEAQVVPDVNEQTVMQAEEIFKRSGLVAVVADSNYVSSKPAGVVLDQSPSPGQRVKKGRMIYLTINTYSIPLVNVPDVADNSSVRQAEAKLIAAGFKLAEVEWQAGEKDWVYGVKYKMRELMPGEKVPRGAELSLMVGDGSDEMSTESQQTDSVILLEPVEPEAPAELDDTWF